MPCLPSWLRTKYEADLTRVQADIAKIEVTINSALENGEVEEYRFDSTEGRQNARRRSVKELIDVLDGLENKEARILRKLNGTSLVNLNLRRVNNYSRYW